MGFCHHIEGVECNNCRRGLPALPWVTVPPTIQPIGWACPKCGTVNNPNMPSCFGCPKPAALAPEAKP
jgi:hypothetical protein